MINRSNMKTHEAWGEQKLDDEIFERTFNHVMELFVIPEINRRKAAGVLGEQFVLTRVQVLLYGDGSQYKVRLNDEAEIVATANLKDGIKKSPGETVFPEEIEFFSDIRLPDKLEPECAHISFVNYGGRWLCGFDFRYNKTFVREHYEVAKQFYDVMLYAHENNLLSPLIDSLFSCVELLAKAELMLLPNYLKRKTTHDDIQIKYNRFVNWGNAKSEFKDALNKLGEMRKSARYCQSDPRISESDIQKYVATAKEMLEYVEAKLAKL